MLMDSALILGLRPANERRCYFVMTSIIGWVQVYNQPWDCFPGFRLIWIICDTLFYFELYRTISYDVEVNIGGTIFDGRGTDTYNI